ncbi:MAG: hypothetical protein AB1798_12010 [Spirochaetota bacterium]
MKRTFILVTLCFLLIIVSACSSRSLYILTDQYWYETYLNEAGIQTGIEKIAVKNGYNRTAIEIIQVNGKEQENLSLYKKISNNDIILLSPLLSIHTAAIRKNYPGIKMIAFGDPVPDGIKTNMIDGLYLIYFDRTEAFKEAGSKAVQFLTGKGGLGILFYTGTENRKREIRAFLDSFTETGGSNAFLTLTVDNLDKRKEIQDFLNEVKTRNITLLLLAVSELNSYCMDILAPHDVLIITENLIKSSIWESKIFLSIELDFMSAIDSALKAAKDGSEHRITVPAKIIPGKSEPEIEKN